MVTRTPVGGWLTLLEDDPRMIATALDILAEQGKRRR